MTKQFLTVVFSTLAIGNLILNLPQKASAFDIEVITLEEIEEVTTVEETCYWELDEEGNYAELCVTEEY
jgi:hypothetical protein